MPMWLKSIFFKYFIHKLSWIREYHTGFKQQLSNSRRWKLFPCSLTFDLNLHMRRFVLRFLWISLAPTPTLAGSELLATDIVGWVPCRVVWQYSLFITTQCYCCTILHTSQPTSQPQQEMYLTHAYCPFKLIIINSFTKGL